MQRYGLFSVVGKTFLLEMMPCLPGGLLKQQKHIYVKRYALLVFQLFV